MRVVDVPAAKVIEVAPMDPERPTAAGIERCGTQATELDLSPHPAIAEAEQLGDLRSREPVLAQHARRIGQ